MLIRSVIWMILLGLAPGVSQSGQLEGQVVDPQGSPLARAVVHLGAIEGEEYPQPEGTQQIDQRSLQFWPQVLAVQAGTSVEFLNSDLLLHNVFSPPGCEDGFYLGTWPTGESRSWSFDQPCVAVLLCNVHPEMEAYVVVTETPFFAVTDNDGLYSIRDVPGGERRVIAWHEQFAPRVLVVDLPDTGVVRLRIPVGAGQ